MADLRHLTALLLATLVPGCAYYCDAECYAGFRLTLTASEGLTSGAYELELEVEGETQPLTCTVEGDGTGACVGGDASDSFRVVGQVSPNIEGLTEITVFIEDRLDQRGPDRATIEVTFADEVVGAADYELEYETTECGCVVTSLQTLVLDLG